MVILLNRSEIAVRLVTELLQLFVESGFFILVLKLVDLELLSSYFIANLDGFVKLFVANEPLLLFDEFSEPR